MNARELMQASAYCSAFAVSSGLSGENIVLLLNPTQPSASLMRWGLINANKPASCDIGKANY